MSNFAIYNYNFLRIIRPNEEHQLEFPDWEKVNVQESFENRQQLLEELLLADFEKPFPFENARKKPYWHKQIVKPQDNVYVMRVLDSVADILFYAVILLRLFPTLRGTLPVQVWWLAGAALAFRLCAYLAAACRYRRFAALHTYLNKCTGALLFALPLLLLTPAAVPISFAVCTMGVLASAEELCLHLCSPAYDANVKSLLCLLRARGEKRQS